jgi:hypothetical protein
MTRERRSGMQSVLKRATLLAAALLVAAGGTARAAVVDVKVPFPFVVKGQQFSPGEYRLERDQTDSSVMLIRGEKGNTARMFVLTTPAAGQDPAGDKPAVTFRRYENQYRLTNIWESSNQGREITPGR